MIRHITVAYLEVRDSWDLGFSVSKLGRVGHPTDQFEFPGCGRDLPNGSCSTCNYFIKELENHLTGYLLSSYCMPRHCWYFIPSISLNLHYPSEYILLYSSILRFAF